MQPDRDLPGFLHLLPLQREGEWLHMCIRHRETPEYLMEKVALDDLIVDALVEEDTRSRIRVLPDGIMVLLKAMHLRGEDMARPEDMVSMRIWLGKDKVITTREADVDPILEIASRLVQGGGPDTPSAFLADLIAEHLDEVEGQVEMLEDDTDRIGVLVAQHKTEFACPNMADTETRISGFLRHLGPQRPVLETLSTLQHPLLDDRTRSRLEDSLNRLLRFLETLLNLRERIDILNDQVTRIQDRKLNKSSYAFAVAATIFLPLDFVTGLFGVNLAGIPMSGNPWGFLILAVGCVAFSALLLILFRWRGLL